MRKQKKKFFDRNNRRVSENRKQEKNWSIFSMLFLFYASVDIMSMKFFKELTCRFIKQKATDSKANAIAVVVSSKVFIFRRDCDQVSIFHTHGIIANHFNIHPFQFFNLINKSDGGKDRLSPHT